MWAECSAAASGKEVARHLTQPRVAAPEWLAVIGSARVDGKSVKDELVELGNPYTCGRPRDSWRAKGTVGVGFKAMEHRRRWENLLRGWQQIERLGFRALAREAELGSSGGPSEGVLLVGNRHRALSERALSFGQCWSRICAGIAAHSPCIYDRGL